MRRPAALAKLAAAVVAAAVLLAAAAVPAAYALGRLAEEGTVRIEALEPLPELALPEVSTLLAADGTPLASVFLENRIEVPLEEVAPAMVDAIIAIEDARFYSHRGVDWRGTARAAATNLSEGTTVQGGSPITQPYDKNVLERSADSPAARAAATEKTALRKLREAHYALELEARMPKDEILERYLNTAFFGGGAYGVEAAARTFFGTSADALTLAQAATIAGLVQSPTATNPLAHPDAALERRNVVIDAMVRTGHARPEEAAAARSAPLGVSPNPPANGCATSAYPFYCDWAISTLGAEPSLGATPQERFLTMVRGGLEIRTSIDPATQAAAQAAVDAIPRTDRVAATVVVVEPGTGAVRAMATNRNYGTGPGATVFPLATRPWAPVGSTAKSVTLAAAVSAGVSPTDRLAGGATYTSYLDNPERGFFSNSEPSGASNVTLAEATLRSQNTAFVQLTELVGTRNVADAARRMGITTWPLDGPGAVSAREVSVSLGAREASVLEMANAYATLAARGLHCTPLAVVAVDAVPNPPRCAQDLDPAVADTVTAMLTPVVASGTGTAAQIGRPVAGKTGTAENFAAAWFCGYTPNFAAAVALADPSGPTAHPLYGVAGVPRVFGGTLPARIFAATAAASLVRTPAADFTPPDLTAARAALGISRIPDVASLSEDVARARLRDAGLRVADSPLVADAPAAATTAGVVLGTIPAAGEIAVPGAEVALVTSP